MAKQIWKALDNLSPSNVKLANLPRKPDGLYNLKVNEYGQLVKRAGYSKYNTTSLGASHKIVGMHRFYQKDLSKEFIVSWNARWYKLSETSPWGGTVLLSKSATELVLTADKDTYFADFDDVCYIVNGADGVFKYDKTYARTVGMTVPGAPTYDGSRSGSMSEGTYYFKITYVDEDGYESNGGTVSAAMTGLAHPDDGMTIIIPVSSDDKVTKRRIYRTSVNGTIYYFDREITNNTTTLVSITQADSTLGTQLHTNHTAPESTSHLITKRRNKLYLAYQDYLYPSHTSDVEYFPATWRIRTGNSHKITGLLEQMTALPVMTTESIERLVGTDEDNFQFKNSYSTEGNVAIRSVVNCDNLLVYLGFNGINYFDGVSSEIFSKALNEYIKDNIVDAYRHLSCATYFEDKYILCYPKTGGTYPTETIWIDLKNKTYGVYSFAFSCFSLWDKGTDGLKLKGGSNTIGQVYSVFDGLDDDGSAIEAYDQIDYIDLGIPERKKNFYKIYVRCEVTTESTLTVYYQTDINTEANVTATLTAGKDQWYEINLPGGVSGRAIKIRPRVSNKYAVTFKGYMIQYAVEELIV